MWRRGIMWLKVFAFFALVAFLCIEKEIFGQVYELQTEGQSDDQTYILYQSQLPSFGLKGGGKSSVQEQRSLDERERQPNTSSRGHKNIFPLLKRVEDDTQPPVTANKNISKNTGLRVQKETENKQGQLRFRSALSRTSLLSLVQNSQKTNGQASEFSKLQKPTTEKFTICAKFAVHLFTERSTVISYAVNQSTNMIMLSLDPDYLYITYNFSTIKIPGDNFYILYKWHIFCLSSEVEKNHTAYLNGKRIVQWKWHNESFLPLDGTLVVGQDQDRIGGGFSSNQAFRGYVTEINGWTYSLTSTEIFEIGNCNFPTRQGNWISWHSTMWKVHGRVGLSSKNSCYFDLPEIYFFSYKSTHKDAVNTLRALKLDLFLPANESQNYLAVDLLLSHGERCHDHELRERTLWIRAAYQTKDEIWVDCATETQLSFAAPRQQRLFEDFNGSILLSNGYWAVENKLHENCFAGNLKNTTPRYYLRGLCARQKKEYDEQLILSKFPNEKIIFQGLYYMQIKEINSSWIILNVQTNQVIAYHNKRRPPVGTNKWKVDLTDKECGIQKGDTIDLALTACSTNEFMCGDGSCIDMGMRCNLVSDCEDWTDEQECRLVVVHEGHITDVPPMTPLVVTIDIFFEVIQVDLLNMAFTVELILELKWYDGHVKYKNLRDSKDANVIQESTSDLPIWLPNIDIKPHLGETSFKNIKIRVIKRTKGYRNGQDMMYNGEENPIYLRIHMQPIIRCHFNLIMYPMDKQFCNFKIAVTNVNVEALVYNNYSLTYIGNSSLDEYHLLSNDLVLENSTKELIVAMVLDRRYKKYMWTTYLPTTLLLIIGYGTLFIPGEAFPERGTMSLTTMLVLVSLYTESLSKLPKTAYNTHIDTWYIFTIVYLALIIATHLVTSRNLGGTKITKVLPVKLSHNKYCRHFTFGCQDCSLRIARILFAIVFLVFILFYFTPLLIND